MTFQQSLVKNVSTCLCLCSFLEYYNVKDIKVTCSHCLCNRRDIKTNKVFY